jgi:hypothetical protein
MKYQSLEPAMVNDRFSVKNQQQIMKKNTEGLNWMAR